MSNILELPNTCIIPAFVRANKNLPDSVKIYYGELFVLASKFGYCFATDEQLSKMKEVSIGTIERWNMLLEEEGLINRVTRSVPFENVEGKFNFKKSRRIFVNNHVSKKVYETPKNEGILDPPKNEGFQEPPKNEGINSKHKIEQKEKTEKEPFFIFPSLEDLDIDLPDKIKLCKKYSEEEINKAAERCKKWEMRDSDLHGMYATLKHAKTWKDEDTKEEKIKKCLDFIKSLNNLDGKNYGPNRIMVGHNYISIVAGQTCKEFTAEDKDLVKNVNEYLEYLEKIYGAPK